MNRVLNLADLELFDPHAQGGSGAGKGERRFLCPLCGLDKPRDAAHRSLCVNTQNGLWNCKRCNEKGLLGEFRKCALGSTQTTHRERAQSALKSAFSIEIEESIVSPKKAPQMPFKRESEAVALPWREIYDKALPLSGTAGANYLARRGIELPVAERAQVLFSRSWHGRPALVFPFRDRQGETVAVAGRCFASGGLDKPAAGPKKQGAFFAPTLRFDPLDEALPAILLCEAPLDALSLAAAGFPALALGGTTPPAWLERVCAFRRVALAFDADSAGDTAASRIAASLANFGSKCSRLRPVDAKDWNEYSMRFGVQQLADLIMYQTVITI